VGLACQATKDFGRKIRERKTIGPAAAGVEPPVRMGEVAGGGLEITKRGAGEFTCRATDESGSSQTCSTRTRSVWMAMSRTGTIGIRVVVIWRERWTGCQRPQEENDSFVQ